MTNERDRIPKEVYRYVDVGFEFVAAIVVFGMLGYMADTWWQCQPLGTAAGCVLGMIVGVYMMIKAMRKFLAQEPPLGGSRPDSGERKSVGQKDDEAQG